ncbi:MAG: hypothetical protein JWO55_694 [Candidatus Saccharibacteria bacterium]|jgi:hypothetical protein|nr:hypothetical protein [Candidatus Saccharibacteria bacterium]
MNANNEDREVVALAQQQFGEDNNLFTGDMWLKQLYPALMTFARQNTGRAIEVRRFVDQHGLGFLDKKGELSQILDSLHAKNIREKAATGGDDLNKWSALTRADVKNARSNSGKPSFWKKFRKFISRHR